MIVNDANDCRQFVILDLCYDCYDVVQVRELVFTLSCIFLLYDM